jgi:2-(1,2-epoxy-1,2-dihydrophenyl)acetyl-CoA isomerase
METIEVSRSEGVVTITMNRPEKKNAINAPMWDELLAAFREVNDTEGDRVLVLTGAGGEFCSGADLTADTSSGVGTLTSMRHVADVILSLHRMPKPTIAKVPGVAAGAGCNLALGCDLIVAGESARFSEIFAKRGLSLDGGGSWLLPRLIGLHKAKELAFFADVISSAEAERFGLVNHVVPDSDLDKFVDEWAARLTQLPPIALSMTKTLLNNALMTSMDQALEDESRAQSVNFGTKDTAEAMRAFVTKTTPTFTGR